MRRPRRSGGESESRQYAGRFCCGERQLEGRSYCCEAGYALDSALERVVGGLGRRPAAVPRVLAPQGLRAHLSAGPALVPVRTALEYAELRAEDETARLLAKGSPYLADLPLEGLVAAQVAPRVNGQRTSCRH